MLRKKLFRDEPERDSDILDLSFENCKKTHPENLSKYFPNVVNIPNELVDVQMEFNEELSRINCLNDLVKFVYNPLEYAFSPYRNYIEKYCKSPKEILFLGMNPGPYGMCQTGVPFGDIKSVKEWLQISGEVLKPQNECPKKPILGFNITRQEISGKKFWGLIKDISKTPEVFFKHCFLYNYCPLAFMKSDGVNVTPTEFKEHFIQYMRG